MFASLCGGLDPGLFYKASPLAPIAHKNGERNSFAAEESNSQCVWEFNKHKLQICEEYIVET